MTQADCHSSYQLFAANCQLYHGVRLKDLRFMSPDAHEEYLAIVINGTRADRGMPRQDTLTEAQAEDIHAWLIKRAQEDWHPGFMQ